MIVYTTNTQMPITVVTTFGVNVKPNSDDPFGVFGTGLKYAIAITLRLGGRFQLFIGKTEYEFYVKKEDIRGKDFPVVRMKKRKGLLPWSYTRLPFTTSLGAHWEPWMAVRELETNTRDEGGTTGISINTPVSARDNQTVIAITCPEMERAHREECIFLRPTRLLQEDSTLQIMEGESKYIFYRGIRIRTLRKPSLMTYNFLSSVTLTEDRTSSSEWGDDWEITRALMRTKCSEIAGMLASMEESNYESSLNFEQMRNTPSPNLLGAIGGRRGRNLPVSSRLETMYRDHTEPSRVTKSVSLTAGEWEIVMSGLRDGPLLDKMRGQLR